MNQIRLRRLAVVIALLLLAACSDRVVNADPGLLPAAASMDIVSGQDQTGSPGAQLGSPVVVRVLDADGNPIGGQIVNFKITAGGGSVYAGTALTSGSGVAQEWWTLGPDPGTNTLEARAVDSSTGEKRVFAIFRAEAQAAVATVAVSPSSGSLETGGSLQLTATLMDDSGATLTNRSITWTSSNTGVATVSPGSDGTAVVEAVAEGTAIITATSEGKSGSTTITVSPPSVLATHNFDEGSLGPFYDPYQAPSPISVVDDPTGSGKGKVVRLRYANSGGDANIGFEYFKREPPFNQPGQQIFFRGDVYVPTPTGAISGIRKLLYWQGNFGSSYPTWAILYLQDGHLAVDAGAFNRDIEVNTGQTFKNLHPFSYDRWHTVEMEVQFGDINTANGTVRLWVNGVLIWERTDFNFLMTTNHYLNLLQIGQQVHPLGTDNTYDEVRFWDDVTISTKRVGQ
jgi:hypothetical protein